MTKTKRPITAGALALAGLVLTATIAGASPDSALNAGDLAVRSTDAAVIAVIAQATRESRTFERMVEIIHARSGIVYVQPGRCGHGVRSCLVDVMKAGSRRILWVKVDVRRPERELMASIGHELGHALEVLDDPTVTNGFAMFHFYRRISTTGGGSAFETRAAVAAGDTVRAEIRKYRRREHLAGLRLCEHGTGDVRLATRNCRPNQSLIPNP
ncbi:MAG TPA: hypothetical protein VGC23_07320 [Vicinamibacterales bacterium]